MRPSPHNTFDMLTIHFKYTLSELEWYVKTLNIKQTPNVQRQHCHQTKIGQAG